MASPGHDTGHHLLTDDEQAVLRLLNRYPDLRFGIPALASTLVLEHDEVTAIVQQFVAAEYITYCHGPRRGETHASPAEGYRITPTGRSRATDPGPGHGTCS